MLIQQRDRDLLIRLFAGKLVTPVRLMVFTQNQTGLTLPLHVTCQWCRDTVALTQELAGLSDKISLEVHDFLTEKDLADSLGIARIPAVVPGGVDRPRIRFYGIPAGYEFTALVEDIVDLSTGTTGLSAKTKERLRRLTADVHIQVFGTPTCPYCPRAVRIAHQMAMESSRVRADAVDATEFPHLAQKYQVMGVPKVVINETTAFEGALPESAFLLNVLSAAGELLPEEKAQFDALRRS